MSSPEERFKENSDELVDIIDHSIKTYATGSVNKLVLQIAVSYVKSMEERSLINSFIINSHIYWDSIKERDEDFFLSKADKIFGKLPSDDVNMFKSLFEKDLLPDKIKNVIWEYFEANVRISINYMKEEGSKMARSNKIDVAAMSEKWGIK